jgi:hypothetical protein
MSQREPGEDIIFMREKTARKRTRLYRPTQLPTISIH